jgi:hypothetical protein
VFYDELLKKMLFLGFDFDRFLSALPSSLYFDLWILRSVNARFRYPMWKGGKKHIPAVPNHAHALGLSLAVEVRTLLKVLPTSDTLSIAESGFSQSVHITPCCVESQYL